MKIFLKIMLLSLMVLATTSKAEVTPPYPEEKVPDAPDSDHIPAPQTHYIQKSKTIPHHKKIQTPPPPQQN